MKTISSSDSADSALAKANGHVWSERAKLQPPRRTIGPRTINPAALREEDIRGVVGKTLDDADAAALGAAFGTIVSERGGRTVALGFDGRLTSRALAVAFARGMIAAGMQVARVGLSSTPMLYFAHTRLRTDAAVMVTGSHDPPECNGFKLAVGGRSLLHTDIRRLAEIAGTGAFVSGNGLMLNRPMIDVYVQRISGQLALDHPLTVAWDASNGAAGAVLTKLCSQLPGRHILLNEMVDGTFPAHQPDPAAPDALEQLRKIVIAEECDLGIAFDGDGDRLSVMDGEGRVLGGDQVLMLLARDVLHEHPGGTIIADVNASQMLFDEVARLGGSPVIARADRGQIQLKISETAAALAGDVRGHVFFGDNDGAYDDALYAAVRLINLVSRADCSLASLCDGMPQIFSVPALSLACDDARKQAIVDEIGARLAASGAEIVTIDGIRFKTDDGWWLLRPSPSSAALIVRCEGTTEAGLVRIKQTLRQELERSGIQADALDDNQHLPLVTAE